MTIHIASYCFVLIAGLFFAILPFSFVEKSVDHWIKISVFLAALAVLLWGAFGLIILFYGISFSPHLLKIIIHYKSMAGGAAIWMIAFLFLSKGIFRFKRQAEQDAAANP